MPALCTILTWKEASKNICLVVDVAVPWHKRNPIPPYISHFHVSASCWHPVGLPVFSVLPCSCHRLRNDRPSLHPHFVKWRNPPPQDALCNKIMKSCRKPLEKARDGKFLKDLLKRERQPPAWQVSEPGW